MWCIKLCLLLSSFISLSKAMGNVDFNKNDFDSPLKEIAWCGDNNYISIVLTEGSSIYRSEDRGLHWQRLTDLFSSTAIKELSHTEEDIGKVTQILQSPADNNLLIFIGSKGINWVGKDCAKSIHALNHGRPVNEYIFHPTEKTWALASAFTLCSDFVEEPCKSYKEIFVTKDLGLTWSQIGSYVIQFGWGITGKEHIAKGIPKERILMTYEPHGKGNQKTSGWNYKIDFVYSDDFFSTMKVSVAKGNKFLLTDNNLFVAEVMDQDSQEVILLGANSTMPEYTFAPIITNQHSFMEHSYSFLDTSLHSVFLHVNHFGTISHYGHIYISGSRGLSYSLSLKNNVRTENHQCDFEKVRSIEGVYIANAISGKYMKLAKREMEINTVTAKDSMGNEQAYQSRGRNANKASSSYKEYIKTFVTFNKGGDWKRLLAPQRDMTGKRYDCGNYCFLNLFGIGYNYPQFYSVASASGIIIANGNVGHYLKYNEVSTFLSRDGGLNWFEIQKGSHIYEIGDHGGLIIIADNKNMTDKIKYTWDEGLTWEEMKISEDKILISNIIIEPSSSSHHFIVYGSSYKNGEKRGVIIGMDFGKVYPQCQNAHLPDTATSDYESWTPNDGRTGHMCLLGHKTTIVRRKRESHCVNNEQFERSVTVENCDCTEDDYQCDVGFERPEPGQPCTRIGKHANESMVYTPPSTCDKSYSISRGYRRIPGDTCVNGFKYDPIILACPYSHLYAGIKVLFYLVAAVFVGRLIYWLINNRENLFTSDAMSKAEIYHYVNSVTEEDNALFEEDDNKVLNPSEKKPPAANKKHK